MKKRLLLTLIPLALALPAVSSFIAYQNEAIGVYAASGYTNSKLPTTIDLNPVAETDIRSYYADLNGKDLNGENLLKALKPILKEGQLYHSYDSGSSVWQAYEITDRDWELSPASSTTYGTYDPATNVITDYVYGKSYADPKNNPYQHLFYRNHDVPEARWKAWDHHGDNAGTDREHIWPKGHGFGEDDAQEKGGKVPGARGDLHHLVASDSYVNSSSHNYYSYGFVDPSKIEDDAGANFKIDGKTVVAGNYRGTSQTLGEGMVFEPQDSEKGDIARACFYMVARYNNLAGDDPNIDSGNPNLTLIDTVSPKETNVSTASTPTGYGLLTDLLAWHKLDPVDDYEIHRNDLIYRNYDKNRNPFIDFPEWVDMIWGTVTLGEDGRTILSRDATPRGKASPSSDAVYAGKGGEESSSSPASSSVAPASSSQQTSAASSSSGGDKGSSLPLPLIIGIVAGVALIVIILIIVATKGKGKAKKNARKVIKKTVKSATKSSSKKKK
ncbi:MAG: hypothetical protein E7182_00690 [Erysipelotrichaceae bacterium]|nr:hypothetical protein [Erysipelotrichaceae bacterium]